MRNSLSKAIQQILLATSTAAFAVGALAIVPGQQNPPPGPGQVPDYFGIVPNFATSPQPFLTEVAVNGVTAGNNASATATVDATGGISNIAVINGGSGYGKNLSSLPTVKIIDLPAGIGATAGVVFDATNGNSLNVLTAGSGYNTDAANPPTVTITGVDATAAPVVITTTATVDATVGSATIGSITGIVTDATITAALATIDPLTTPTVSIVDSISGSGATATAVTSGTTAVAGNLRCNNSN